MVIVCVAHADPKYVGNLAWLRKVMLTLNASWVVSSIAYFHFNDTHQNPEYTKYNFPASFFSFEFTLIIICTDRVFNEVEAIIPSQWTPYQWATIGAFFICNGYVANKIIELGIGDKVLITYWLPTIVPLTRFLLLNSLSHRNVISVRITFYR